MLYQNLIYFSSRNIDITDLAQSTKHCKKKIARDFHFDKQFNPRIWTCTYSLMTWFPGFQTHFEVTELMVTDLVGIMISIDYFVM